jgi:hypothetical protein
MNVQILQPKKGKEEKEGKKTPQRKKEYEKFGRSGLLPSHLSCCFRSFPQCMGIRKVQAKWWVCLVITLLCYFLCSP